MDRLFMFEKPLGMRDTLPELFEKKKKVRTSVEETIGQWGYRFIETPALEYYETVGAASAILDRRLFKLLDQQGHTLVLRPDMTAPIARVAASRLMKDDTPLKLAYSANVFRAQQREGGRPAEFEQIGVECLNDETVSCDGEMIALLTESLEAAGLKEFQISIGHIGFVEELFQQILGTSERAEQLRKFLYEKNYVGYREHVNSLALSSIDRQRLLQFLELRGGPDVIEHALGLTENGTGRDAIGQLSELWGILEDYGVGSRVKFDLTLVSHMSYYTGILFEVYADRVGFPLGNGGRYNGLLEKFGRTAGATGFAIRIDRLLQALGTIKTDEPIYCILFSPERRKEAFQTASILRKKGKRAVLQDIGGVRDVDAFARNFDEITYLLGGIQNG
ncbi:ATP phosphoribosyltransferase regulatory subunit [Bacillus sp. FJAT-27225]|uniref:ATP phosphoribosyltransferase regulatory subunit n=1 Tax=Bacillus sp. FJAT-27225 TaxID=1743144 RepID=UPI00080C2E42|nr:ATP phosphoribosyltransferase regulatory subunit [Bacillus sp. FJAT-27225]OCA88186.1 ATP phosphoribosyltransferase regulatory subunit [Bacillus sp. FJAT-27225]